MPPIIEKVSRLRIHRTYDWIALDDGEEFLAVPVQSVTMVDRPVPSDAGERDSIIVEVAIARECETTKLFTRCFKSDDVAEDLRRIVEALGTSSGW